MVGPVVVILLVIVVFVGVAKGYCVLQIPAIANFILLFLALLLLAYCEALHYSVVSIEKWDMAQVSHLYPQSIRQKRFLLNLIILIYQL